MGSSNSKSPQHEPLINPINDEDLDVEKGNNRDLSIKDDESRATFSRMAKIARPQLCLLIIATIALFFSSTCQLAQPYFFGKIIEVSSSDRDDKRDLLNRYTFMLLIILVIGGISTFVRGWVFTLVGEKIVRTLRSDLFKKIANQDISFFDTNKTGELMNRLSSDTAVIQSCLSVNISMGLRSVSEIIVSIALLFITSWKLTCVMMAVVPALMLTAVIYGRFTKRLAKDYQDALAGAADTCNESISNSRIMKSFGAEDLEIKNYIDNITKAYRKGATKAFAYGIFAGGLGFLAGLAILVVVYYGATLVIAGKLNIGDLTAFILYTIYIAIGLAVVSSLYTEFMNALGASERIFKIMDMQPAIPTTGGKWPRECTGHIAFENVNFKYPTRRDVTVLNQFNLVVQPNQTVALVGASGSGKSTVLCLIERFYDVVGGQVTIDGVNLKDIDPRWLHRNIAIVPQEPVLFSGSIRSNIMYSRLAADPTSAHPATDEEVIAAGKQANAHEFIMTFPDGYDTIVGERGVRLSGGQKQRVAIARALLANPKILLLDEATSALDAESEMLVQDAINKLMKNRTVIIIAHRLSTVRDADMIGVFSGGKIVDAGTHQQLLTTSTIYANLVRKQLDPTNQHHHGVSNSNNSNNGNNDDNNSSGIDSNTVTPPLD